MEMLRSILEKSKTRWFFGTGISEQMTSRQIMSILTRINKATQTEKEEPEVLYFKRCNDSRWNEKGHSE